MPNHRNNTISQDMRDLVIRLVINQGKSQRDAARITGIPRTTIQHIVLRYENTYLTTAGSRGGNTRGIFNQTIETQIRSLINDYETTTIEEIKTRLQVTANNSTVWRWVKKLGFTYKLTRPIYERRNDVDVKNQRIQYIRWYTGNTPSFRYRNIIYIDESPFNIHMFRSHSWAMRGVTPNPIIRPRQRNVTMILAINGANIIHCEAITTSVNGELFQEFMRTVMRILGNEEQYIFVMDNVNFHHRPDLINSSNFSIRYLPPYSPFLNPCEEVFSYLKSHVRREAVPRGNDDLINRMREACEMVPNINLSNYYSHCESFFEACLRSDDIGRD
ncbi:MAG: IS630 family transposase [Macrococcoides caseolyticum]